MVEDKATAGVDLLNEALETLGHPCRLALVSIDQIDFAEQNARYMSGEMFRNLVSNIAQDGGLSSVPLCIREGERFRMVSGEHRVKAAQEAGISPILILYDTRELTEEDRIARQLSHNAIAGEDDPAILKELWAKIRDVGLKYYAGLDDKQLKAMAEVGLKALSEARLAYTPVTFLFLPEEAEHLKDLFQQAAKSQVAKVIHLAAASDFDRLIASLDKVKSSYAVYNSAVAMTILLSVLERHVEDLAEGWYDPGTEAALHREKVPIETVLGTDKLPSQLAARLKKAVDRSVSQGTLKAQEKWRIVEHLLEAQERA